MMTYRYSGASAIAGRNFSAHGRRRAWRAALAPVAMAAALLSPLGVGVAGAAPFTTDDLTGGTPTPTALANILAGPGVSVSNVTYSGADNAAGTFAGGAGIIGFNDGIVLSSGDIANIVGPNVSDGTSVDQATPGDADLDSLTTGATLDAAILEFDFVPDASTVFFSYVFGSEEYNEFVNSSFNDVFGFFVTAAGSMTKANCAVVADGPDADSDPDPVTINTINNGNPFGSSPSSHPELYRNNDPNDPAATIDTGIDGLTVTLVCEAVVVAGQANHLKLAIADTSDGVLDAYVLLQAGSLTTTPSEICDNNLDDDGNDLIDGADPACAVVAPMADLGVAKSCTPTTVLPGGQVTCTLTVTNAGPADAADVVVTDSLASGTTLVGTPGGGGFACVTSGTSPQVSCTLASLPSGSTAEVTVVMRVDENVGPGTALTDTATVSSATPDPTPANDTASFTVATPACTINAPSPRNADPIFGTPGDDVICGTAFGDIINGRGGNDIIFGLDGNDIIKGGDGNDTIFGGAGNDIIEGGSGDDSMFGGSGDDTFYGGIGNDSISGGAGKDTLDGDAGNDTLVGGAGADTANGGAGVDACSAELRQSCES